MNPPRPNLIPSFSRALIKCQRGYLVVKIRWFLVHMCTRIYFLRRKYEFVAALWMVPWKNAHCGTEFCQPIPNQQSGCIQQSQSIQFSTMDPDFPISSFLGERNRKKKRILYRENIPCLSMFVLVGGSTPFKPWNVEDQGTNLPVKFPSLVKSIILVAEFPYVCFYQTIFCQLNPMLFLCEIPFCWVKPCDGPRKSSKS